MAWNASGVYSRPTTSVSPAVDGTTLDVADQNTYTADVAAGINACLAKNGENSPSANLPMGSNKHTGVATGTARTEYAAVGQVQDGTNTYALDTGAADAYVITLSPAITSYPTGLTLRFKAAAANTGASTININAVAVKDIKTQDGAALKAGQIVADGIYTIAYNGTNFILQARSTTGVDAALVTGTAGTTNKLAKWDANGDLIEATTPTGALVGTSDTQTLTNKTITNAVGVGQTLVVYDSTTSITWQSDTAYKTVGLSFSDIAVGKYALEAYLFFNDVGGGGIKIDYSTTAVTDYGGMIAVTQLDGTHVADWTNSSFAITAGSLTASGISGASIVGTVQTTNATNSIDLQVAQNTSDADTLTVSAGSWLKLTRVE